MRKLGILAALLVGLLFTMPAFGAAIIDFGQGLAGVGGVFTLTGGNATGANIPIGVVTISGAPSHNGVFLVTGSCTGSGGGSYGCLNFDTSGNTISITGAIPTLGIGSETLLSGTFTSFTANTAGLSNATGPDTKAADLLATLGLTGARFNYFGFTLTAQFDPNTGTYSTTSTDMRNTAVPEPATIVLFGTLLFGCGIGLRRRVFQA